MSTRDSTWFSHLLFGSSILIDIPENTQVEYCLLEGTVLITAAEKLLVHIKSFISP